MNPKPFDPNERPDDHRRREDAAIRMETQFSGFVKLYEADKLESKEWRERINQRLIPLEDLHRTLSTPAKIIGTVLLLMVTPAAGLVGWTLLKKTVDWLSQGMGRLP